VYLFKGQGQKETMVLNYNGIMELIELLPGTNALLIRCAMREICRRYFIGDTSMIKELQANAEAQTPLREMARQVSDVTTVPAAEVGSKRVLDEGVDGGYTVVEKALKTGFEHTTLELGLIKQSCTKGSEMQLELYNKMQESQVILLGKMQDMFVNHEREMSAMREMFQAMSVTSSNEMSGMRETLQKMQEQLAEKDKYIAKKDADHAKEIADLKLQFEVDKKAAVETEIRKVNGLHLRINEVVKFYYEGCDLSTSEVMEIGARVKRFLSKETGITPSYGDNMYSDGNVYTTRTYYERDRYVVKKVVDEYMQERQQNTNNHNM
jgi:hypothetical protein